MNIYKVSQSTVDGYDTYDSMIVVAENSDDARNTHPDDGIFWDNGGWSKKDLNSGHVEKYDSGVWCEPKHVNVELIGVTDLYSQTTVILYSFNAG